MVFFSLSKLQNSFFLSRLLVPGPVGAVGHRAAPGPVCAPALRHPVDLPPVQLGLRRRHGLVDAQQVVDLHVIARGRRARVGADDLVFRRSRAVPPSDGVVVAVLVVAMRRSLLLLLALDAVLVLLRGGVEVVVARADDLQAFGGGGSIGVSTTSSSSSSSSTTTSIFFLFFLVLFFHRFLFGSGSLRGGVGSRSGLRGSAHGRAVPSHERQQHPEVRAHDRPLRDEKARHGPRVRLRQLAAEPGRRGLEGDAAVDADLHEAELAVRGLALAPQQAEDLVRRGGCGGVGRGRCGLRRQR